MSEITKNQANYSACNNTLYVCVCALSVSQTAWHKANHLNRFEMNTQNHS